MHAGRQHEAAHLSDGEVTHQESELFSEARVYESVCLDAYEFVQAFAVALQPVLAQFASYHINAKYRREQQGYLPCAPP